MIKKIFYVVKHCRCSDIAWNQNKKFVSYGYVGVHTEVCVSKITECMYKIVINEYKNGLKQYVHTILILPINSYPITKIY